uniref:Uncharacterized protein n=1 Tax=Rhodosorus marinus TaxID=101924 RepID=A0A7S3A9D4_9RHOD|mmetsp:Transcript_8083/g.35903  ORF Transcript_8083/g.35903 Transcript_8083/m.35903 type:complete len:245 (+) Transcript_8083:153-887(+)
MENEVEMVWTEFLQEDDVFSDYQKMTGGKEEMSFDDDFLLNNSTQSSYDGETELEDLSFPVTGLLPAKGLVTSPIDGGKAQACQGSLLDPTSSFWRRVKVTIRDSGKSPQATRPRAGDEDEFSVLRPSLESIELDEVSDSGDEASVETPVSMDLYARLKLLMHSPAPPKTAPGTPKLTESVTLPEIGPVLRGVKAAASPKHESSTLYVKRSSLKKQYKGRSESVSPRLETRRTPSKKSPKHKLF